MRRSRITRGHGVTGIQNAEIAAIAESCGPLVSEWHALRALTQAGLKARLYKGGADVVTVRR